MPDNITTDHGVLLVLPTMGSPQLVLPNVQRIITSLGDLPVRVLVVCNPTHEGLQAVGLVKAQAEAMVANAESITPGRISMDWLQLPGPAGWTGAVNAGIRHAMLSDLPPWVVVMNDDLLVTPGWLESMVSAMDCDRVHLAGQLDTHGHQYLEGDGHDREHYGTIGMVGPVSGNVAGAQRVQTPGARVPPGAMFEVDPMQELDRFCADYRNENHGVVLAADFLSGFCTMYRRECLLDLLMDTPSGPALCDPVFGVGGYDDNDLCVRAEHTGWRRAIALDTYVHHLGHRTLDPMFPEAARGLANLPTYLDKWSEYTQRDQRVVATYRVKLDTPWDLTMLRASLLRVSSLVDGLAIVFTGNPNDVHRHPEFRLGDLEPPEAELVAATGAEYPDKVHPIHKWVESVVLSQDLDHTVDIAVDYLDPEGREWNERDERNHGIDLAHQLDPDWIWSVDHDEVPEDRITRPLLLRLTRHPDPLVQAWDLGWINHWDTPRLARQDPPYCMGYRASMRGFRLWRVTPASPRIIQGGTDKGLHCGNSPDFSEVAKRVAALRFRHFGYLRLGDRRRKWQRYSDWMDPDPQARLTGGGYDHVLHEESMTLTPYMPANGIAFTMLVHSGERVWDIGRHLDLVYGLADQIVLVWTDEGEPPADLRRVTDLYGVQWTTKRMGEESSLAECRNAGLEIIRANQGGIRWVFTMDPDEHMPQRFQNMVSIRRMAEITDSMGWMFQFKNHRADGTFNMSETVRMFVLDKGGVMRWEGRVHEKLEASMDELKAKGIHPRVRYAPFIVDHVGLGKTDEQMQAKLTRYTRLLTLAIQDEPDNVGHWTAMGLQFGNEGMEQEQAECLAIARDCGPTAYLPWKASAQLALRQARRWYEVVVRNLGEAHPFLDEAKRILEWLNHNAPEMPKSGSARLGHPIPPDVDLPSLVELYKGRGGEA